MIMKRHLALTCTLLLLIFLVSQCETLSKSAIEIQTGTISNQSYTTAIIDGQILEFGKGISDYGHCWSTSANPTHEAITRTSLGDRKTAGSYTSELENLSPGTSYNVRAYALNEDDEVTYGDNLEFTTLQLKLPGVITTDVTSYTETTAMVGGEVISSGGDSVSERGVYWGTEDNPTESGNGTKQIIGSGTGSFSFQLTALTPATTYYVEAYAVNSMGMETGGQTSFKTDGFEPEAGFSASKTQPQVGESVQFTDQSTNNPTSWEWDFGDGTSSTQQNPSHTYNSAATFSVTLTASNDYGSDSETKTDYIVTGRSPVSAFSVSQVKIQVGESVQFTDQSTNNPTSWEWDFGDGSISTLQNPLYTYNIAGTYTVKLTVSNDYGSDMESKPGLITAGQAPVAAFVSSTTEPNLGESVQFTDQSTNNPTSWWWEFGDGNTSTEQHPAHAYNAEGSFTVKLTSTNNFGSNSLTKENHITVITQTVTDINGHVYPTVVIGEQTWMAKNLWVSKFSNGDGIAGALGSEWDYYSATMPMLTAYDIDWMLDDVYGYLYNGLVVTDSRNVCPDGWHVPTQEEWTELWFQLGGDYGSPGGKLKEVGLSHWNSPNTGATDSKNFTALPGGSYEYNPDTDSYKKDFIGDRAYFWSSTEDSQDSNKLYCRYLSYDSDKMSGVRIHKNSGLYIRCIKD